MKEVAVLLKKVGSAFDDGHIAKVLGFFGVSSRVATIAQFVACDLRGVDETSKLRLLCSAGTFLSLINELACHPEGIRLWRECVHSTFVFATDDVLEMQELARHFRSTEFTSMILFDRTVSEWVVSEMCPEFCGSMSGIRVAADETTAEVGYFHNGVNANGLSAISAAGHIAFAKTDYHNVPLFLSTASQIIDIDAELTAPNFDIRTHFLSAVPIVMFVKWAFAETCWKAPEINACLIIDDPLLRPQYGFLNFRTLLNLMERHKFTTNIAFIPWNWRRSAAITIGLFQENPRKYSLSIHGCDHTAREFGNQDVGVLARKARLATERMSRHEVQTGIRHDRIMVFPQGVFSRAAPGVLKHTNFMAAVNTEVHSTDPQPLPIRISDVWDVAVMHYDNFPIFTRRYPSQGVENFAFDILLGKPCLVVIHHDFFRDRGARLVELVNRLNALNCRLSWGSLGDVLRSSCRQREVAPNLVEMEMYGSEVRVENHSEQQRRFSIAKQESDGLAVKEIRVGSREIPWTFADGRISFDLELGGGQSTTVRIISHDYCGDMQCGENVGYKLKTMLRRYLSEVRDTYAMRWGA